MKCLGPQEEGVWKKGEGEDEDKGKRIDCEALAPFALLSSGRHAVQGFSPSPLSLSCFTQRLCGEKIRKFQTGPWPVGCLEQRRERQTLRLTEDGLRLRWRESKKEKYFTFFWVQSSFYLQTFSVSYVMTLGGRSLESACFTMRWLKTLVYSVSMWISLGLQAYWLVGSMT